MAEIHRKRPLIVKRMESFHKKGSKEQTPKKKSVHVERLKAGAKIIGGGILSGLKKVGKTMTDPETHRQYEKYQGYAGRIGSASSSFFAMPGYDEPRRKSSKKKTSHKKKRR